MRKNLATIVVFAAAMLASSAMAQGRGGGMGAGMGAGPPVSPPGQAGGGFDTSTAARDIGNRQGSFGRDFAEQQRMSSEQYRQQARQRKDEAIAFSQSVRNGRVPPDSASRQLRTELKDDIDAWRDEFRVGRKEWMGVRDQWLADRDSLTPQEWAQRRVDWFDFRDAWIARQKDWASTRK